MRLAPRRISGGTTVAPELVTTIERRLQARFVVAFGQTETHGHITQTRPDDNVEDKAYTVGRALPHVEVKVTDPVTDEVLPPNVEGELCTRSPMLMTEYLGLPEVTASRFDRDGFLRTGDLVVMDDRGYVRVRGRLGDTICRVGRTSHPPRSRICSADSRASPTLRCSGSPTICSGKPWRRAWCPTAHTSNPNRSRPGSCGRSPRSRCRATGGSWTNSHGPRRGRSSASDSETVSTHHRRTLRSRDA